MIAKRVGRLDCALGVLLLIATNAHAQPSFDAMFDETLELYGLPGMALGIVENGEIVYARASGELRAGSGDAITRDSLFKIASNSKAMTTALLARLVDAGALKWDDPVIKYLPALRMHDAWVTRELQIRDLLIHNSGLGLGAGDLMLWPEPNQFTRSDVIAALAHLKPTHSFRSHYAYDNILYIVAGEVAAAAGGAPYEVLMQREVFTPLGMSRCQAGGFDRERVGSVAQPHMRDGDINVVIREDDALVPASTSAAAGGVRCSLDDMLRWIKAWVAPGESERDWLTPEQRAALWTPQMPLPLSPRTREWEDANLLAYGYGWRISDSHGQLKVAHTGTLAGMYSVLSLLPESGSGWVILINGDGSRARVVLNQALLDRFADHENARGIAHYAAELEKEHEAGRAGTEAGVASVPARQPASKDELATHLGVYRDPWFGDVSLCANGTTVELRSHKSPRLRGTVLRAGDGWLVDWLDASVDAEPWLHFAAAGKDSRMTMSKVDPDADFSYDYGDLSFTRTHDCD